MFHLSSRTAFIAGGTGRTSTVSQSRNYVLGDPELDLIGDREKLAQWRHKGMGPPFYKLGRKIIYRGADLNAWAEARRVEPSKGGQA